MVAFRKSILLLNGGNCWPFTRGKSRVSLATRVWFREFHGLAAFGGSSGVFLGAWLWQSIFTLLFMLYTQAEPYFDRPAMQKMTCCYWTVASLDPNYNAAYVKASLPPVFCWSSFLPLIFQTKIYIVQPLSDHFTIMNNFCQGGMPVSLELVSRSSPARTKGCSLQLDLQAMLVPLSSFHCYLQVFGHFHPKIHVITLSSFMPSPPQLQVVFIAPAHKQISFFKK